MTILSPRGAALSTTGPRRRWVRRAVSAPDGRDDERSGAGSRDDPGGNPTGVSPADLVDRQVQAAIRYIPWTQVANALSAVLLAVFALPARSGWFRVVWPMTTIAFGVVAIVAWAPLRWRPRRGTQVDVILMALIVLAQGTLNGVLAIHALPISDAHQAVLVCSTIAGTIGVGAIALSTVRLASYTWIASNVAVVSVALLAHGTRTFYVLEVQFLLYGGVLAIGVASLSRSFTTRCTAELEAEAGRRFIALLLNDFEAGSEGWLWETDRAGRLSHISDRLVTCAALPPETIAGFTFSQLLLHWATPAGTEAVSRINGAMAAGVPFENVDVELSIHGQPRYWRVSGKAGSRHRSGGWRGVGADVTDAILQRAQILDLARSDTLTGLANRRTLSDALGVAIATHDEVVLGLMDLDNFKSVNDTLGHVMGDALLASFAQRLVSLLGPGEFCARMGGDEFAIIVPATTGLGPGIGRLHEIQELLRAAFRVEGTRLELRVSMGVAAFPRDGATVDALVVAADLALYDAKAAGRDGLREFTDELTERAQARATALQNVRTAIDEDQFELYFQPQVHVATGTVTGFEALLRWHHPEQGFVAPDAFIAVAEETGLIVPLGAWVLEEACRIASTWPSSLVVALNVSPFQLVSDGFTELVERVLQEVGLDPARVVLEITESGVLDGRATATVGDLKALGVSIALDDFGTGYASLSTLRSLPLDRLKIDRSFIAPLGHEPGARAERLVSAILTMAAALEMDVIAEGVETAYQRHVLRRLGCPHLQGYVEARPMPAGAIASFLASRADQSSA